MTTDLDTRLTAALIKAAATTHVSDDAFEAIIQRAGRAPSSQRPKRWILAGGLAAAAAVIAINTIATNDRTSGPPTLAMIRTPALTDSGNDCGTVTYREATPDEASRVTSVPVTLPNGYTANDPSPATVQERAGSSIECWSADVTYLDATTGRLLSATVSRQGNDVQPECQIPDSYQPEECVTVAGRPAALTHEGTRAAVSWITDDGSFAYVAGFGLTTEELLSAASTLAFDGTNVTIQPPNEMAQVEQQPRTRSDDRDVTYYRATFSIGNPADDITLSITTWNDLSINEVGPATTIDLNGTTAIAVTTGGPGTGITGWTRTPDSTDPLDASPFDQPAGAYVTWNRNGVTFRVEGPDPDTVAHIARQLHS